MQISPLRQLMRIYKDLKMELTKTLDVNFAGEEGADMGGPTKEYFHIALSSLSKVDNAYNLQLFGGSDGHLVHCMVYTQSLLAVSKWLDDSWLIVFSTIAMA